MVFLSLKFWFDYDKNESFQEDIGPAKGATYMKREKYNY